MALREIAVRPEGPDELRRRWFHDPIIDIYTWEDAENSITRFQICYKLNDERSISWASEEGFSYHLIDSGEDPARHPRAPTMKNMDAEDHRIAIALLHGNRDTIEHRVYEFLVSTLERPG